MENEVLLNLKEVSIVSVIIAVIIFGLTMLIKWPIKKATAKLEENKRKAVNTVIVFIPMFLSFILNALYYGVFCKNWFTNMMLDGMLNSYLLALGIYAIYSKIVILIKGAKNSETNSNLSKETVEFLKANIKTISKALKLDEKNLIEIVSQIEKMVNLREEISCNSMMQDISSIENLDKQICELKINKQKLEDSIKKSKSDLEIYKNNLNKKGE